MCIELFEHNRIAYESVLNMLDKTGKTAVIHPTGTGKSFIGFKLAEDNKDKIICWLSPSDYIFKTQIENLVSVTNGWKPDNIKFYTYAKLMFLTDEDIADIQPDYIILDEFHRCGADQWGKSVEKLLNEYADIPILGLSATNIRYLDNQRDMADELFDGNIASEISLGEAIVRGILAPPKYVISVFSYQKDLERYQYRVKHAKNKAVRDAAQKYLDTLRRTLEKADGLDKVFAKHITEKNGKYIVFCSNVDHLNEMISHVDEWFGGIDKGLHVYKTYSDDPEANNDFISFKADNSEHLKLLFCIDMLNEGIHVDDISGVILFRPTVSPIIYKQQIGRALAAGKSKNPLILDVINNFDNLYSIGAIEDEMASALNYYHYWGNDESVINERFEVIDEVRDCREIFDQLHETLSASWDLMYQAAAEYHAEHGDLVVSTKYKTATKLSLGTWLMTQRKVRAGKSAGILTEHQIEKLDSIGMIWENRLDLSWSKNYEAAKKYYENHEDLDVAATYVTDDGIALGSWITKIRQRRASHTHESYLSDERIKQLNEVGMIWDKISYVWEQNYLACVDYYIEHGDLDIPFNYISKNGLRIGMWIRRVRQLRNSNDPVRFTEEQVARLNAIGMDWGGKFIRQWEYGYEKAVKYYKTNGHVNVPATYVDENGFALGRWLKRHITNDIKVTPERKSKLDKLGMIWEKEDSWEKRIKLCKEYYEANGNLNMPHNFIVDGIWLKKWVTLQKKAYKENKLTSDQIIQLEGMGINWISVNDQIWETYYAEAVQYYQVNHHLDVPHGYKTSDGVALGKWVATQRKNKSKMTIDQKNRLDEIEMIWDRARVADEAWERNYTAAVEYYKKHGNLNIPKNYISENGVKLAYWVNNVKSKIQGKPKYNPLTKEQIKLLKKVDITAISKTEQQWQQNYEEAKKYYETNGNLAIPSKYITENSFNLGYWIYAHRQARNNLEKPKMRIDEKKIELLDKIGMVWEKNNTKESF